MSRIKERLDKIYPKIIHKSFRENKGLGNEIGFYIFDYDPRDELVVRQHIAYLKEKINNDPNDITIKEFDLFEIIIEILEEKGYLEKVFEMEQKKGTNSILKPIKNTLRLTQKNDMLVDYIRQGTDENAIVFITGVGKAWPIIRSHTVLNSLHAVIDFVPLVMFYPGTYSGQDLLLFNEFTDQNYYRAFKLIES